MQTRIKRSALNECDREDLARQIRKHSWNPSTFTDAELIQWKRMRGMCSSMSIETARQQVQYLADVRAFLSTL